MRTTRMKLFYKKKTWALGLWLVWLCGIFLIGISFYATHQMLPSSMKGQIIFNNSFGYPIAPKITIFTAPRPFHGSVGERQNLAIKSWLGLAPDVSVVLLSQDVSAFSSAGAFGSRVSVEPNIDFTFLGNPFLHSMVARAQMSSSDISVLVDPEILLFPDFISTLRCAHKLDNDWFLFALSRDIPYFPFHLDADGKFWLAHDGKKVTELKLQEFVSQNLQKTFCRKRMLMAWSSGDLPLHKGVLPPFLYGKGHHDHWIVTEALSSDYRFVFDASSSISNIFVNDLDHKHHQLEEASNVSALEKRSWEFVGNSHLAMIYGSFHFHEANYSNLFKFLKCGGQYLFVNTFQNIVYPLGNQMSFRLRSKGLPVSTKEEDILSCNDLMKSIDGAKNCSLENNLQWTQSVSLPLSLEGLLTLQADQNKTIVLAVAGYSYKDMLMSWVCRLRQLQILNFLVCAIDPEVYEFSVMQGLPVFEHANVPTNISFDNCHFGTECFQKVTKVKSRIVLQILKLGFSVLMSDVDVYWFKNPLPLLTSFGPATFIAQSDEYMLAGPINLPRRLNSGFYYAHSDSTTVAALEKVVKHAANSNLSEQPSFYDMLCGEGGSNRVGDNKCLEPETNLTVHFLDRDLFPNGAYQDLWQKRNVRETCTKKGCFILHNNWISGRRKKLERQVLSGLWEYDFSTRMCVQSWHKSKRWIHILGLVRNMEKESKRQKQHRETAVSLDLSIQFRNNTVQIVHAGGRKELYHDVIPASRVIEKNPGMCVGRPEIFKRPLESLMSAEDYLIPGQKYYLIPRSTYEKLKHKYLQKRKKQLSYINEEPILAIKDVADVGAECSDESLCSAKDFYVSREMWSIWSRRKSSEEKKPFVPPIQKPRIRKELEWEPSLGSIQEVSP